jgi:hypothetical protein
MSTEKPLVWNQPDAVELCRAVEAIIPPFGYHIALTGGVLYKDGPRKDVDILFYPICASDLDWSGMWVHLEKIGLRKLKGEEGYWCVKAEWHGKPVDCFFAADGDDGTYGIEQDEDELFTELFKGETF